MRKFRSISLVAISLSLMLAACGGDDDDDDDDVVNPDATAGTPDAADTPDADPNQPDAPPAATCGEPALAPRDDGTGQPSGGIAPIIISEISIDGGFLEVYNDSDQDLDLTTLSTHMWCSRPSYAPVRNTAITVPAKGYAQFSLPTSGITNAGGDLQLYMSPSYASASAVLDYVCWGSGGDAARKTTAETAGKWNGGCAPAIPSGGSLVRRTDREGDQASDYETAATPTPETCTTL